MDPPACYSEQKATVETAADTGLLGGRWPHPPWLQGVDEYGDVLCRTVLHSCLLKLTNGLLSLPLTRDL